MTTIQDRIYNSFTITEPVLIELIVSSALQRLKGINQFGIPQRLYHYPEFSRYEHSIGVMLILRKLDATIEEQVAGLIHDVSHTAFSHLVDWVIGDREKEDYQDNNFTRIVGLSTIPKIVMGHGLDFERVTNLKLHSLLERPTPDLCADRVDYALREFNMWANPEIVQQCIDDLINFDGKMIFKTKDSAEKFARGYAKCQREHWGGAEVLVRNDLLARALKISLERNVINSDDFYAQDEEIIRKLNESGDKEIDKILTILERKKLILQEDHENPQFNLKKKFRYIDPQYLENDILCRLSESDLNYRNLLDRERKLNEKGIKVRLIT
ncbi:HD domain-containing protein [Candidatus Woesearchaeota archaeon]|nr:HD domain-containing protein [Candidatus Woesearchaeota archaeon]